MKSFIQHGVAAVNGLVANFTTSGVVIQPPNSGNSRIFITDVVATNNAITLLNAGSTTTGGILAYIAQGNCNFSVPIDVSDFSGVAIIPANSIGSINYFLE
jgi:hypothetical protein